MKSLPPIEPLSTRKGCPGPGHRLRGAAMGWVGGGLPPPNRRRSRRKVGKIEAGVGTVGKLKLELGQLGKLWSLIPVKNKAKSRKQNLFWKVFPTYNPNLSIPLCNFPTKLDPPMNFSLGAKIFGRALRAISLPLLQCIPPEFLIFILTRAFQVNIGIQPGITSHGALMSWLSWPLVCLSDHVTFWLRYTLSNIPTSCPITMF